MTVVLSWSTAALWWRRTTLSIKKFVRSLEPRVLAESGERPSMPSCVWYGRSVFCFHVPSSTHLPGAVEQERVEQDTR